MYLRPLPDHRSLKKPTVAGSTRSSEGAIMAIQTIVRPIQTSHRPTEAGEERHSWRALALLVLLTLALIITALLVAVPANGPVAPARVVSAQAPTANERESRLPTAQLNANDREDRVSTAAQLNANYRESRVPGDR